MTTLPNKYFNPLVNPKFFWGGQRVGNRGLRKVCLIEIGSCSALLKGVSLFCSFIATLCFLYIKTQDVFPSMALGTLTFV